ncbi:cupin domain-containing protein [Acetobacter sicerae]|uniref:hypothetical protein n=1 Tax=Acetobacter sicerae TaxID=85325 RepID=UPI001F54B054|nr:hypothetical protein [Acetobacter sicerae]
MRKLVALAAVAAGFWTHALHAETKVTPLIAHHLQGIPGKEGAMLTVDYPPPEARTRSTVITLPFLSMC